MGFGIPGLDKVIKGAGGLTQQFSGVGGLFKGLKPDEVTSKIKSCEKVIEKLPAEQIPVSGTKSTKTGEFVQEALNAMKYDTGKPDGAVGGGTIKQFNQYMAEKNAPSTSFSFNSIKDSAKGLVGRDEKFEPLNDASEITGKHIEELIDALRDGKHLPANPQLLQKLAESAYEIGDAANNPELQKLGRELSTTPLGAQSSIEGQGPEQNELVAQIEPAVPTGMM